MSKFTEKIKNSKLFALIVKLYNDTRIRFLFVGCLNTLIGLVTDTVVCLVFQKFTEVPSSVYLIIGSVSGTVLGAINSYFWNKYFTFKSRKKSLSEAVRFAIVYIVCFLFSYFAQLGCLKIFGYEEESIYFYIAKVCVLIVQVFLSWFGQRYFCFKKEKPAEETTENLAENHASEDIEEQPDMPDNQPENADSCSIRAGECGREAAMAQDDEDAPPTTEKVQTDGENAENGG